MKKVFMIIITCCYVTTGKACDICGCGVGSGYIGILPDFKKQIIGLRYRMSNLKTHVGAGGSSSYLTTNEYYHVTEIWAAVNLAKKLRVMATIPFNFNRKESSSGSSNSNGLGDASLQIFYNILNKKGAAGKNKLLVQSLWLGSGVKLPTGKYHPSNKQDSNDANIFQLGTGSTDLTLNLMYDIRLQDVGININSSYKINTANRYDYRYGNKFSLNTQLYHKFRISDFCSLAPNAGISLEYSKKDKDNKYIMDISGGKIAMGIIGTEISYKKIVAGFNWQQPVTQDLANGLVKANNKAMFHIAFAL